VRVATQYAPPLSSIRERRGASRGRADGNVAAVSHSQHVPTLTDAAAWRVKAARPGDLDLLTLKVVPESRAMWATSVPILVFLGISVLDLST